MPCAEARCAKAICAQARREIPAYACDGWRLRTYSISAIERLLSLSLVVVRLNRRGIIVSAQFRETDGANPLRNTVHLGQRYSYAETIDDGGHRAWRFAKFLMPRDDRAIHDPQAVERDLQRVFRAVALSCLVTDR